MYFDFEVCGKPFEGILLIRDTIANNVVDYSDYQTRDDEAATEFICSAVRDYLSDLH